MLKQLGLGRDVMKDGLRVFDADTHVEPTAEVLDTYVDPGSRPRLDDLAPYRMPVRATPAARRGGTSTATARSPISASSARRRRATPIAAATPIGWAARCRGSACR